MRARKSDPQPYRDCLHMQCLVFGIFPRFSPGDENKIVHSCRPLGQFRGLLPVLIDLPQEHMRFFPEATGMEEFHSYPLQRCQDLPIFSVMPVGFGLEQPAS